MIGTVAEAFPETYQALSTPFLLSVFAHGPERVRAVLAGLDDQDLRRRPRPDGWCIREIVAHLADSELMGAVRVRMAYVQPGVHFVGYDQDAFAQALEYQALNEVGLERALRRFEVLRESSLAVFARAEASAWDRWGVHPEWGPMTLRNLLELYADHAERHIGQVLRIRELLGKPLRFPLLLEERLY